MTSDHDSLQALNKELIELHALQILDARKFAAAVRYVESNRQEMLETLEYSSVSEVADTVCDIVSAGCSNGKCG